MGADSLANGGWREHVEIGQINGVDPIGIALTGAIENPGGVNLSTSPGYALNRG
jgi:hypothetical protein